MQILIPSNDTYLAQMVNCQIEMARETEKLDLDSEIVTRGMREVISNPARGHYLLAISENKELMGMLMLLTEWSDWRCAEVLWIHSVSGISSTKYLYPNVSVFAEYGSRE